MEEEKAPEMGLKGKLDRYTLIQELGRGLNAKVYLGQDAQGTLYAIKRLKTMSSSNMKAIKTEIDVLKNLNHANVIRLFEFTEGVLHKPSGASKSGVVYAVLELAPGGEVFQFLMSTGRFPLNIARYYFKQMIAGLNHCHEKGYAHRDIKPENLLLNAEFDMKLADFGFATALAGRDGSGKLNTVLGTESYMAPEIHLKTAYSGASVDLFAAAIVLFIMVTGHPPFNKADPKDPYYLLFCTNRHQRFWDLHSRNKPKGFFSKEFITLMNGMLAFDPTQRLSLSEIASHSWLNESTATEAEVRAYMAKNKATVDADLKKERDEAEAKKKLRQNMKGGAGAGAHGGYRSTTASQRAFLEGSEEYKRFSDVKSMNVDLTLERALPTHQATASDDELKKITTILDADDIIKLVVGHFVKNNDAKELEAASLSAKEFKMKGLRYKVAYDEFFSSNVEVGFRVEKIDEDTNVILFNRLSGDSIGFFKVLKDIRNLFFLAHQQAN